MTTSEKTSENTAADAPACDQAVHAKQTPTPPGALRACVEAALNSYFAHLDGHHTTDVYALVLQEIEVPLLTAVMRHAGNNQCAAAQLLGINRGTLRKKLKQYDLL